MSLISSIPAYIRPFYQREICWTYIGFNIVQFYQIWRWRILTILINTSYMYYIYVKLLLRFSNICATIELWLSFLDDIKLNLIKIKFLLTQKLYQIAMFFIINCSIFRDRPDIRNFLSGVFIWNRSYIRYSFTYLAWYPVSGPISNSVSDLAGYSVSRILPDIRPVLYPAHTQFT